jgi:RNA polymerase sigma-70 factor (ECF subfamily)
VSDPESDLMLRVKAGEEGAFTRLVARFLRPLVSFFHRLGADASIAEDCAQEVFVKVYRTRATYEVRAKFSTYLFSIARHHWIDVVRHRAAGPSTVSSDAPAAGEGGDEPGRLSDRLEGRGEAPESGVSGTELARALRAAVEALPAEQREVFALTQVEGLRYEEIALILRVPVGTVKSRMHTAVRTLRARLARDGFEP